MKVRAMKDTQTDPNFCVVARVEAFIAGWPVEEALRRATAYAEAGADAILMHSKKSDPSDIDAFCKHWDPKLAPVVIVPTNYPKTPVSHFQQLGPISTIIYANHNVRASIAAMKRTTEMIFKQQSTVEASQGIVPVKEVFRLQHQDEYLAAEDIYLPKV
jgi:phosphoenolpyruvate phosphomutase